MDVGLAILEHELEERYFYARMLLCDLDTNIRVILKTAIVIDLDICTMDDTDANEIAAAITIQPAEEMIAHIPKASEADLANVIHVNIMRAKGVNLMNGISTHREDEPESLGANTAGNIYCK